MGRLQQREQRKIFDTNINVNLALLQIGSMPMEQGLPRQVTILFSRPIIDLLPKVNRSPMLYIIMNITISH